MNSKFCCLIINFYTKISSFFIIIPSYETTSYLINDTNESNVLCHLD